MPGAYTSPSQDSRRTYQLWVLQFFMPHQLIALTLEGDIATFCMACSLKVVAIRSHLSGKPSSPSVISGKLHGTLTNLIIHAPADATPVIAKNMRKGRQEDSHEFLRYAIEALQKSSLAGHPPYVTDHTICSMLLTTWFIENLTPR